MQWTGRIAGENLKDIDKPHLSARHHKVPRVWMVVMDDRVVKIFRKSGPRLECLGLATPSAADALLTNRSVGRVVSSSTSAIHHKYEPHAAERYRHNISFTHALAQWLGAALELNAFDHLVIAAAPRTLGNLRKALGGKVRAAILSEISKDLTRHPEEDLKKEFF
ncbi:MAG: host attachment protein [Alphaproteobacteria bacterium]|nr:host attachment protein [Alphaproteobacteria bacterium]MDE2335794.1 host attachment protein [Alphaproteobacteria bacterium]